MEKNSSCRESELKKHHLKNIFYFVCLALFDPSLANNSKTEDLQRPVSAIKQTHKEARVSQNKINQLDDETKQLLQKYRTTLNKTENLRIYNQQMSSYIEGQKKEILETRKKIEGVKDTGKEIEPLMLRMLDSLDRFVDLDMPFLLTERKKRIQELKEILNRSDVSISEKYRQLISAYKLEQDYGRTLQSYREIREIAGKELTVDYLRLGRLVLIYKSLDGKHLAYWNHKDRKWKPLSRSYKKHITNAVKIALKQIPPDLIKLPVPSMAKELK